MNLLNEMLRYHTWANLQLIDYCGLQSPAELQKLVIGTDRSIMHTLTHLVGSEQEYLETLLGKRLVPPIHQGEILALRDLRQRCESLSPYWEEALDGINRIDLTLPAEGSHLEIPHGQNVLVLEAIQHGIDHRTQICTTLHVLGLGPLEIDGWAYWRAAHPNTSNG